MEYDKIIDKILMIPRIIQKINNVSPFELLKTAGYFELFNKITEDIIVQRLSQYPEFMDEWIAYSEDKRTQNGYYIKREENLYLVGYINHVKYAQNQYINKIEACAKFIKNEIEDIRKTADK